MLSGCNVAMSDKPLFAATERSISFRIADGLWLREEENCPVDLVKPYAEWPKCAGWVIVADHRIVGGADIPSEELPQDIFIVDGPPPIVQAEIPKKDRATIYYFFALEPRIAPAGGKLRALTLWIVPCGTEKKVEGASVSEVTPFEGFSPDCVAASKEAVLRAATRRPVTTDDVSNFCWIRFEAPPAAMQSVKVAPERG
jgi:hypothetical protein